MSKPVERVFNLEDAFMNHQTDDLLYGFLRGLSTAKPTGKIVNGKEEYEEYLDVKAYIEQRKIIADICGCSSSTIGKHLSSLEAKGLVKRGKRTVKYEEGSGLQKRTVEEVRECFYFPVYMSEGHTWKKIDKEMLTYLIDTRNAQCIKVYLYLLNNYHMKRSKGQYFYFDYIDINVALGYSRSSRTGHVSHICQSFQREGIIKIEYESVLNEHATGEYNGIDQYVLTFIAEKVNQLEKLD